MAYRGEDLDLRTQQTWNLPAENSGGPASTASEAYTNGRPRHSSRPVLVDDVVLACCNHAYDVAAAHRSMEVRLEHLLHAMTRVDSATGALEARGIRVAGLRRESATIIASEIPIGLGSGQTRPRRSDELEAVIRTASNFAARRNGPANVDDVIDALLDMPSDVPGISLLARHGGRSARDRSPFREPLPLPPLSRTGVATELRSDSEWRSRSYADAGRHPRAEPPRNELRGEWGRELQIGSATDGIQNARIEQIESTLRALTSELSNERGAIAGLMQDVQRSLLVERDDTSRFRGGLDSRLSALERAVLDTRGTEDTAARLLDRIASVENGLVQQVSELSRPWAILSDRLQAMEQALLDMRQSRGVDLTPLQERLQNIERAVREAAQSKPSDLESIANRLDIIEEAVLSTDASKSSDAILDRVGGLEDALAAQGSLLQKTTSGLTDELKSLGSSLAAQSGSTDRVQSMVSERLQALAASFERQRADVLGGMMERLSGFANALDGRIQHATQPVAERVSAFSTTLDSRLQSATVPLNEKLAKIDTGLQAAVDSLDERIARALAPAVEKIGRLETALAASIERTKELQTLHSNELKEVHDALLKLNTNQHTLAGSIDQWRLDGVGDISVIATRLEGIEKAAVAPNAMLQQLTSSVDKIGKATVERYHRRNRFWYWLFGTDDWLGASWPSQVAAVESERQSLRGTPARTPPPQLPR